MCLYIDTTKHLKNKNYFSGYQPLIAQQPIKVYKILEGGISPFYAHTWKFDCLTESSMHSYKSKKTGIRVEKGLHAYKSRSIAISEEESYYLNADIHIAYIPKGAKYYIGKNGDIVSNGMWMTKSKIESRKV